MRRDARPPRTFAYAIASIALVVPLTVACRSGREANVLEFWALGREGEIVKGMVPEFERRHPGVRLHVQQIPWSAAHEKLLTAYVGESMPDVFQLGNTWIPEFVTLGAVDGLDERIRGSRIVSSDDYFPGILDTSVIDGVTYGLPWYVDTRLLFYRTDLVAAAGHAEPPRTWDAWLDAMTRTKKRAGPDDFAVLMPVNEWQPLVIFALQRGAELLREGETRGNFETPVFREAFVFYVDLFRRGLAPLASQAQVANLYQDFARGGFAFYVTGPWNLGEFRARLPKSVRWSTAPLPAPGESYPGLSLAGGSILSIFRGSAQKELAWQLLEYLAEPAQQIELYRQSGDLPARKSAWTDAGPGGSPEAQAFWTQLEHVEATPKIPEWERIATAITRHAEAAIRGRDVDQALAALDRDVDEILEKRRWMAKRAAEKS